MSEASLQHYLEINGYDEEHDDVKAYKANHEVFKGGLSKYEVAQYYSKWAEDGLYDEVRIHYFFLSDCHVILNCRDKL